MTEKRFRISQGYNDKFCHDWEKNKLLNFRQTVDLLNELAEENKELHERNNRQAKQLDNLYQLIEQKDWRALSDILDDFKLCEEQLQNEWKCYE